MNYFSLVTAIPIGLAVGFGSFDVFKAFVDQRIERAMAPVQTMPAATCGEVYAVTPDGRGPHLGDFVGTPDRDERTGWVRWKDKAGAIHMSPAVMEFVSSGAPAGATP